MRRVDNAQQKAGGPLNNYQFDFGLGGSLSKPQSNASLKDQKQDPQSGSYSSPWSTPLTAPKPAAAESSSGWSQYQSNTGAQYQSGAGKLGSAQAYGAYKPLGGSNPGSQGWGVRPSNGGYTSDVSLKLGSAGIAGGGTSAAADVFGDLLGGSLGRSSTPMNKTPPSTSFSSQNVGSSLPKSVDKGPIKQATPSVFTEAPRRGPSTSDRDPFHSLPTSSVPFGDVYSFTKTSQPTSSSKNPTVRQNSSDDPFGLSESSNIGTKQTRQQGSSSGDQFSFSEQATGNSKFPFQYKPSVADPVRSSQAGDAFADVFGFGKPSVQRKMEDPLEALLSRSTPAPTKASPARTAAVHDDDWVAAGFGGGSSFSSEPTTTELEGLPPPPAGVTSSSAHKKGVEFYKAGQFPDAIKWLSWGLDLNPDTSSSIEMLTCRISCLKEIGEYKKAIGDCAKAIALDPTSVQLIMQRASLYESNEKYKLGVADLKEVLKLDPNHRIARLALTRLEKMIDQ